VNIAQILRQSLLDADAVNIDGTTHRFVTEAELLTWAQEGHERLLTQLRRMGEDFGLVVRQSTDADLRWNGITYDCSSFGLTATGRTYTLPPDLIELRQIRALTSGYEDRLFEHKDLSDPVVVAQIRSASDTTTTGVIRWDIVGERTLRLALPPDVALDIEISYIASPRKLRLYSTGTVSTTQDSAAVTGASTPNWVIQELSPPMDLIIAASSTAPKIVSQTAGDPFVDPSVLSSPVLSIDTNTTLTLLGPYLPTAVSTKAYLLASVPSVPDNHQWMLVRYVTAMIRWKASGSPTPDLPDFQVMLRELAADTAERQSADPRYVEDYDPEWE